MSTRLPVAKATGRTTIIDELLGGKVRLFRQNANPMIYARAYVQGGYKAVRTKTTDVREATKFAEDWFYALQMRIRSGEPIHEPMFSALVAEFLADPTIKKNVKAGTFENYSKKWNVLEPHCRGRRVSEINAAFLEKLQLTRGDERNRYGVELSANTISKDFIFLGQVLRWGQSHRKHLRIDVPEMPKQKGRFEVEKIARPLLTPDEWKKLRDLAEANITTPAKRGLRGRPRDPERAKELYAFMLFTCGGALRVGEAYSLRWMDCSPETLPGGTPAIHAMVLGKKSKHGKRQHAWVMFEGEKIFHQLKAARPDAKPEDKLFRFDHATGFRELLQQADLYLDPQSHRTRNTKSLRVTGICLQLARNPKASRRDVADWCRTSERMLEDCYNQLHPQASAGRVAGKGKVPKRPKAWDADWTIKPVFTIPYNGPKIQILKNIKVRPYADSHGRPYPR